MEEAQGSIGPTSIRAKFTVSKLILFPDSHRKVVTEVELVPVTNGSKENEMFFKYTPYGKINMGILPEHVAVQFILGREYYVDFSIVESATGN
jgi:hypothetical protein